MLWRVLEITVAGTLSIRHAMPREVPSSCGSSSSWQQAVALDGSEAPDSLLALPDDPTDMYTYLWLYVAVLWWLWTLLLVAPYSKGEAVADRVSKVFFCRRRGEPQPQPELETEPQPQ